MIHTKIDDPCNRHRFPYLYIRESLYEGSPSLLIYSCVSCNTQTQEVLFRRSVCGHQLIDPKQ